MGIAPLAFRYIYCFSNVLINTLRLQCESCMGFSKIHARWAISRCIGLGICKVLYHHGMRHPALKQFIEFLHCQVSELTSHCIQASFDGCLVASRGSLPFRSCGLCSSPVCMCPETWLRRLYGKGHAHRCPRCGVSGGRGGYSWVTATAGLAFFLAFFRLDPG